MITPTRLTAALVLALLAAFTAPAAASAAPALGVTVSAPDYVSPTPPQNGLKVNVSVQNIGDSTATENITVTYHSPPGIPPVEPHSPINNTVGLPEPLPCTTVGQAVECEIEAAGILRAGSAFTLEFNSEVEEHAEGVLHGSVEVSGGGGSTSTEEAFTIDTGPVGPFAVQRFEPLISGGSAPASQAGASPEELDTALAFTSEARTNLNFPVSLLYVTAPTEDYRDVLTHLPAGLIGNPGATPSRCTAAQLSTQLATSSGEGLDVPACPVDSQVGVVHLSFGAILGLYNMVPPFGSPAELGFIYKGAVVTLDAHVRPSDHGIDLVSSHIQTTIPVPGLSVDIWGVPGDSSHDTLRRECISFEQGFNPNLCSGPLSVEGRAPFLRTPTTCSGEPLSWEVEADTYPHPATFVHKSATTPALEGCQSLPFDPSISAIPSDRAAHTPSGLDFSLTIPQETGADSRSEADLRAASVNLPEGVSINPASADGLAACTDAELGLGEEGPSHCPDSSKLGAVEVHTPLLEEPLGGSVYLRSQASQDPASGQMYRLAIELRSERYGLAIKLPGQLKVDPSTGQLTTVFDELPQLPFEEMDLHFKTGPRAPLTTPSQCGRYTTNATLGSWSGKSVQQESTFTIDGNCEQPGFAPGFEAGVENPRAGAYSPFTLRVTRGGGMPNIQRITATLPEGELAKLAGVPLCSDAAAAVGGACPSSSQIGRTVAGVGEGSSPLYLPQPGKAPTAVYLGGPYRGAPFSVVASVPAQSGPFDLGTVVVRSALSVDPITTRATVTSDPLPQIFGGIPVSYRDVRVEVDRPEFTLTPTSCEPQAVDGKIAAIGGQSAAVSARFQASDCAALGFKPKLSLYLKGKTRRAGYPALTAVLKMPKDGANVARASVALPHAEFLAQNHIDTSCTRVQYAADGGGGAGCPKGSVYGRARAFSPLLDQPLEGPLYLRSNGGERELPDLVASLDGQIHVDLVGYIDSDKKTGGLRTTFANVPDAPVSKFVLRMPGGRMSLLRNSTNICHGKQRAIVKMSGQNGRLASSLTPLKVKGCGPRNGGP